MLANHFSIKDDQSSYSCIIISRLQETLLNRDWPFSRLLCLFDLYNTNGTTHSKGESVKSCFLFSSAGFGEHKGLDSFSLLIPREVS